VNAASISPLNSGPDSGPEAAGQEVAVQERIARRLAGLALTDLAHPGQGPSARSGAPGGCDVRGVPAQPEHSKNICPRQNARLDAIPDED
jgi:hypothetical protein